MLRCQCGTAQGGWEGTRPRHTCTQVQRLEFQGSRRCLVPFSADLSQSCFLLRARLWQRPGIRRPARRSLRAAQLALSWLTVGCVCSPCLSPRGRRFPRFGHCQACVLPAAGLRWSPRTRPGRAGTWPSPRLPQPPTDQSLKTAEWRGLSCAPAAASVSLTFSARLCSVSRLAALCSKGPSGRAFTSGAAVPP